MLLIGRLLILLLMAVLMVAELRLLMVERMVADLMLLVAKLRLLVADRMVAYLMLLVLCNIVPPYGGEG